MKTSYLRSLPDIKSLKVPKINHILPTDKSTLVCSLELSGYMPDHLDFLSYFARYSASKLKLATNPTIHMPTDLKRFNTLVSPFVQSKTKQVFESKLHKRCIQVYDGSPMIVDEWVEYIVKNMPSGVDVHVDTFRWENLGVQKVSPIPSTNSFTKQVEEKSRKMLNEINGQV